MHLAEDVALLIEKLFINTMCISVLGGKVHLKREQAIIHYNQNFPHDALLTKIRVHNGRLSPPIHVCQTKTGLRLRRNPGTFGLHNYIHRLP